MNESLPTIAEADAEGPVAALYADIRHTLGVPVVNLIWRHLATFPDGLEWAWRAVRPLYAEGRAEAGAAAIRERLGLPDLPPWPPEVFAAAGLGTADLEAITAVLASYDRGNTLNLSALGALAFAAPGGEGDGGLSGITGNPVTADLPPLLDIADMDAPVRDLVFRLNMLGERDEGRILASLYRHLAHWPAFLALAWTVLAPLERDGTLNRLILDGSRTAQGVGRQLLAGLDLPEQQAPPGVSEAVGMFVAHPIAKMVPIGALLHRLTPDAA